MKSVFISILVIGFALNAAAQYNDLEAATAKNIKLAKITEWTISTDSLTNTTDSSCVRLIYNRSGRLIEKDYDFNKDQSIFISVVYSYNDKGFMIDSMETIPYVTVTRPVIDPVISSETIYGKYPIEKVVINKWANGELDKWTYIYMKYLQADLLSSLFIQTNIKQGKIVRFEYSFLGD